MNAELSAVCDRILSAVLNGAGQGLLLLLLLMALLKVFRRANAATRHALELTTLVLLAALPVAHFCFQSAEWSWFSSSSSVNAPSVESDFNSASQSTDAPVLPDDSSALSESRPAPFISREPAAEPESTPIRSAAEPWNISLPRYTSAILVAAWCFVSLARMAFLIAQLFALRALKRNGLSAPEPVRELFSKLCVELGVSRAPQLRVAARISAPMAVGFKEPAVLLPENVSASPDRVRLEQILRHELAHVLRRDDWANLLQQMIRALFFFHPGVIWTSRRLTVDREIACDDHVLSALGDRKSYALSLTEFASRNQGCDVIAAPAAWSNNSQLKQRISMILDTKRNTSPRLARGKTSLFAAAAMIAAILVFQAAPRFVLAQPAIEAPPAEPAAPAAPAEPAEPAAPAGLPESGPRAKAFIGHPVPPRAAIGINAPAVAPVPHVPIAIASGGGLYLAAGGEDAPEDGAPRPKNRRAREGDDPIERRLDRLERLVEKLAQRDAEKKDFQFQFQDKFNPNFKYNQEDFAKLNEKFSKEAQKAAEKAARDAEKVSREMQQKGWAFENDGGPDGLMAKRKILEQQREVLEKQVQALQRQIQKLERDQQRLEDGRLKEELRRNDKRRAEEKERGEEGEKEKDSPKR